MESTENTPTSKSEGNEPKVEGVQVVLWDFDGPTSNSGKISRMLRLPIEKRDWPKYFEMIQEKHPKLSIFHSDKPVEISTYSVYIDNDDLLKATLAILNTNNIKSVIASQRITFAYGDQFTADVLTAIQKGEAWPEGAVDFEKYEKAIRIALEKVVGENELAEIILNYLSGKLQPDAAKKALEDFSFNMKTTNQQYNEEELKNEGEKAITYNTYLDRVIGDLRIKQQKQEAIRYITYENLKKRLGSDRPFLLQNEAELIGKTVALQGIPTSTDKFSFTAALKQVPGYEHLVFDQEHGQNALLVDDNKKYGKNFPKGMFVEAPRKADASPDEDNAYLAQVLVKSVAFPKLLQDLSQYQDKQAAEQLFKLVFIEKLSVQPFSEVLTTVLTSTPGTMLAAALPLIQANNKLNPIKNIIDQISEIENVLVQMKKQSKEEQKDIPELTTIEEIVIPKLITSLIIEKSKTMPIDVLLQSLDKNSQTRGYLKEALPYVIENFAKALQDNKQLLDKEKKTALKDFVLTVIRWLDNYKDLTDSMVITRIIEKLKDPEFDDLLRLETGGHKKAAEVFANITKKEVEKQYGMTATWSDILDAAKNRVESNIKGVLAGSEGKIKVSNQEDQAFRELLGMPSGRFATQMGRFWNHLNIESKTKQLLAYEQLHDSKQKILRTPEIKPTEKKRL